MPDNHLLKLAESYYSVAHDLISQGERAIEVGQYLGALADEEGMGNESTECKETAQ